MCIRPWLHWFSGDNDFTSNFDDKDTTAFKDAPYLSDPATGIFSNVKSAEDLEERVEDGVSSWYGKRKQMDFFDSNKPPALLLKPDAKRVARWMSHLLLTTTTNVIVARENNNMWLAPPNHFYDQELLSQKLPSTLMVPDFYPSDISKPDITRTLLTCRHSTLISSYTIKQLRSWD